MVILMENFKITLWVGFEDKLLGSLAGIAIITLVTLLLTHKAYRYMDNLELGERKFLSLSYVLAQIIFTCAVLSPFLNYVLPIIVGTLTSVKISKVALRMRYGLMDTSETLLDNSYYQYTESGAKLLKHIGVYMGWRIPLWLTGFIFGIFKLDYQDLYSLVWLPYCVTCAYMVCCYTANTTSAKKEVANSLSNFIFTKEKRNV